jgi:hypothetical protein
MCAPPSFGRSSLLIVRHFLNFLADYHKRQESELSDRCKGVHSMLRHNLLTYTAQPVPFLGRVDLAAVFLDRQKLVAENIAFGNAEAFLSTLCVRFTDRHTPRLLQLL